jgi:hypothetical protein
MIRRKIPGHEKGLSAFFMAFFITALVAFPGCRPGPERAKSFKTIFDHYRERENIVAISFPPGLVGMFLSENDPDQAELKSLFQELSTFRMLSLEEGTHDSGLSGELRTTVMEFTNRNQFADLFRMQTAGEDIFIRILEKDGAIREAILMFGSENTFFVADLRGNIDPVHFKRLAEDGQLQSLINLTGINH